MYIYGASPVAFCTYKTTIFCFCIRLVIIENPWKLIVLCLLSACDVTKSRWKDEMDCNGLCEVQISRTLIAL